MQLRQIGTTDLWISPVALGCWPISGMSSLGVNDADSLATIEACFELGINHLDTAYSYGASGESDRLIRRAVGSRRDELVIATKGGMSWSPSGERILDGRPQTLRRQCDESLMRLGTDRVELFYLHVPDPNIPLAESAGALKDLLSAGKVRSVGVSNCSLAQMQTFHAVCPISAVQPPYNLLQRQIEADIVPWCRAHQVSILAYWPLMKGLLAGKLPRDHRFQPGDNRTKYPMFQGDEWEQNQDFLDVLRRIAVESGATVAQLAVHWILRQPGIGAALCGAKRPAQIRETAGAMHLELTPAQLASIDQALARRGAPLVKPLV